MRDKDTKLLEEAYSEITEGFGRYDDRVREGLTKEKQIIDALNENPQFPWIMDESSEKYDKMGIDAFIGKRKDGKPLEKTYKVQIKTRTSGDDILLELMRPWNGKFEGQMTGRDMKQEIDLYLIVDRSNTVRIIKGEVLKDAAKENFEEFLKGWDANKQPTQDTKYGQVIVRRDPAGQASFSHGDVEKVITFVDPARIDIAGTIKLNV